MKNINRKDFNKYKINNKPKLFLSYNSNDSRVADIIETQLCYETNDGINISRYTSQVEYKNSFKKFMNSIEEHDFVLCIVSDNYLKSKACMYEVGEVIKNHHYEDKLLFVVLNSMDNKYISDNTNIIVTPNIYDENKRVEYIKFWQDRYNELKQAINGLDDEAKQTALEDLKEIGKIYRNDIGTFLNYLSDYNGKSFDELYNNNFNDIIKWIIPNWETRLFTKSKNYSELLTNAIEELYSVTKTDYNQFALKVTTSSHTSGLVVFADNVSDKKQRYRLVIVGGLMSRVAASGKMIYSKDIKTNNKYFSAVPETESELIMPIIINGNTIGVINSEAESTDYYSDAMISKIEEIANNFAIALNRLGYSQDIPEQEIPYIHAEF